MSAEVLVWSMIVLGVLMIVLSVLSILMDWGRR